jgi:hypothetical protein
MAHPHVPRLVPTSRCSPRDFMSRGGDGIVLQLSVSLRRGYTLKSLADGVIAPHRTASLVGLADPQIRAAPISSSAAVAAVAERAAGAGLPLVGPSVVPYRSPDRMPRKLIASVRRHIEDVHCRVLLAPARVSASPDPVIGPRPTWDTCELPWMPTSHPTKGCDHGASRTLTPPPFRRRSRHGIQQAQNGGRAPASGRAGSAARRATERQKRHLARHHDLGCDWAEADIARTLKTGRF